MDMKKIILLTLTMLGALSCTIDNEEDVQFDRSSLEKENTQSAYATMGVTYPGCFSALTAQVSIDVSGGFGNPVVVFTPASTGTLPFTTRLWARVEVQALSDCDLIGSGTGSILAFGPSAPIYYSNSSSPVISVLPANLPSCYKWRYVFEGINSKGATICLNSTRWQESPIF